MKVTKATLQRIIQEELSRAIQEQGSFAYSGPDPANALGPGEIMSVVDVLMKGANLNQRRANEMMADVDKGTPWVAEIVKAVKDGKVADVNNLGPGQITHAELVSMAFALMEPDIEDLDWREIWGQVQESVKMETHNKSFGFSRDITMKALDSIKELLEKTIQAVLNDDKLV